MSELLRSRHAFGSESSVDTALQRGLIDAYDILFLNEGKIGWIDKYGNKVILENTEKILFVDSLPQVGEANIVYVYDSKFYLWNGMEFVTSITVGMDEEAVNEKVRDSLEAANAYTDEKFANVATIEVIEF